MIDTHLLSHPLATVDEDIKFKLEQALGMLYEVYQLIGSKSGGGLDPGLAKRRALFPEGRGLGVGGRESKIGCSIRDSG